MSTSPLRIREYLRTHPAATAADLSRALECTPANIRYHLGRLVAGGEIRVTGQCAGGRKGRPVLVYGLSPAAQENNLVELAGVLLEEANADRSGGSPSALEGAALRLAGSWPAASQHLTRRLANTIHRLNELAYHARWEAHAGGPRIYLAHCPYAALLDDHADAMCRFDACLLVALLGAPVKQLTPSSVRPCVFSVQ
jgi:predicted ArsR family transcriptional regulator